MPIETDPQTGENRYAPAKVRAKLFVQAITQNASTPGAKTVSFNAVSRGEENKEWAQYTPSANLTMTIKAGPAADYFELGKEYFVDFIAADEG